MENSVFENLKLQLSTPKNIVLIPHRNPDGDAMGSSLGMSKFLKNLGHRTQVVLPNEIPDFLKWMPGVDQVYNFEKQNRQSVKALEEADLVFLLDFNAFHRVGDVMGAKLESLDTQFVMIDHHQAPDPITEMMYSDTSICATCQMAFHFIERLKALESIDADVATCLYTGIMTDTGSFKFPSTTSTTHRVIADLIDRGADNARIHNLVFDQNSYNRLQLLGQSLSNMKILVDCHTAYICLSDEELRAHNFQKGDTEGVVNYALSVKGVTMAAIFIEDIPQGIIKISFRSKGSFSVNKFARAYFNGGGHDNASGGRSTESLEATAKRFVELVEQHKSEIQKSYEG
ncbi:MAG: DHH family phosphoesterase [Flavobacteriaceae bacterium]